MAVANSGFKENRKNFSAEQKVMSRLNQIVEIRNKQKNDAGFMIHGAIYILYVVSCSLNLLSCFVL